MEPSEHEVTHVVESRYVASSELGDYREHRRQHPSKTLSKPRCEVIQDQLRRVGCRVPVASDGLTRLNVCNPEVSGWAFRQVNQQKPIRLLIALREDEEVGEALPHCFLSNAPDSLPTSREHSGPRDDSAELIYEADELS